MTPYQMLQQMERAKLAGRQLLTDPGSGGTVKVGLTDLAVLKIVATAGSRTLQAAAQVAVGTQVLVASSIAGAIVNTIAIGAGEFALFQVTLNSSAANQWSLIASTDLSAQAGFTASIPLTQFRVWDAQQTNLPGTAATDDLSLKTGATFLTTDPYVYIAPLSANGTTTAYAAVQIPVPINYAAGSALSIDITTATAVAAATSSSMDLEVLRTAAPTVDLVTTSAADVNAVATVTTSFTLTPTNVVPGELLVARLKFVLVDSGTSTDIKVTKIALVSTGA